jgi:enamine deaminase RidA (YjgF/YER057c/UK114 family)
MELTFTNPAGSFAHPQFTSIVTATHPEKIHFFSGRCPVDENYRCVAPGDMREQFKHVMRVLTAHLAAVGADWINVVHRRIYTTDMDACLAAQEDPEVLGLFDRARMPGSTMIQVARLSNPDFLVEIEIVAVA